MAWVAFALVATKRVHEGYYRLPDISKIPLLQYLQGSASRDQFIAITLLDFVGYRASRGRVGRERFNPKSIYRSEKGCCKLWSKARGVVMNSDPKDDGAGLAFGGKTEIATLVMTLRPDEAPLGELSLVDWRWLETAMTHLTQIDHSRRAVKVCDNAYCTFDVGLAYFQCLAPPFGSYLRCETVSEKCVPEIAEILTPEKRDRLVQEFGFSSSTKNFEQRNSDQWRRRSCISCSDGVSSDERHL